MSPNVPTPLRMPAAPADPGAGAHRTAAERATERATERVTRDSLRPPLSLASAFVASAALVAGNVQSARAQPPAATTRDTTARATYRFDIPAGPLARALTAFERVTSLRLDIFAPLDSVHTAGVSGTFTPQQAIARLLAETQLTYMFTGGGTVTVRRRATTLGTVAVTAARERAPGAVSSPKYTEPPVDIPKTITVVNQEQLRAQGGTSLRDAVRNVPGITINAGEGGALPGDNFNVRGFSATNDIFVDGVRDVSGMSRESFNIEQVEVTKGPSSSVSGRGSTGGSINMVTKAPGLREARTADIQLGSADQRRATVDVNMPLDKRLHGAALRVNAVSNESGVAGNDVIHNESWGVAPSLAVGLGTPTQVTLSYLRSKQDNIPSYGVENFNALPTVDTRHFFGLRSIDFEKVASEALSARVDHQFNPQTRLVSQFTRNRSETGRIVTPVNPTTGVRSPKTHRFDNNILSGQTNLNTAFRTGSLEHSVVFGLEAIHEKSLRGAYNIVNKAYPKIVDLTNPTADADFHSDVLPTLTRKVRATSLGAYAFETLKINRYVEMNGNLRWDDYKPEYTDSASLAAEKAGSFKPAHSRAFSGGGAFIVKPRESGSIYASYATSFNPSTENLSNDAISAAVSLPPERSRSYEIGTKWEVFKRRALASLALFRTEKTNARTSDPANPGLGTILSGKQRVQGGELSVTGQVTRKWNLVGGYSLMNSKYIESLNKTQQGTGLLNVPKHSISVWTTYQVTRKVSLGGGARYLDDRLLRTTDTSQVYVPSYHLYDAVAKYNVNSTVGVQANLSNLADKLYYDSGRMWVPAAGRALSVTTSIKF